MRAPLIACLLLPAGVVPDLLLPGHKDVHHALILDWGQECDGHRFVASPVAGLNGSRVILKGEPFQFSGKYRTRIYAAPAGVELPDSRQSVRDVPWPSADVPVDEVGSIAASHPLARVETTLRVKAVGAGRIELELVGERRFDAHGRELGGLDWLPLAVLAAAGALWTVSIWGRAKSP